MAGNRSENADLDGYSGDQAGDGRETGERRARSQEPPNQQAQQQAQQARQNPQASQGAQAPRSDEPNPGDSQAGQDGSGAEWADQSEYQERTKEWTDIVVPDGQMKFRAVQESPVRQGALLDKYDVTDFQELVGQLPQGVDIQQDPTQQEPTQQDTDDQADAVMRMIGYIRDLLVPNIIRPNVHWADSDADGFDLSTLSDNDLKCLMDFVSGKDAGVMADDPEDRKQARAEKFR